MNHSQSLQIRSYLESKKLPLDVVLEVEDHFTEQVETLQDRKNIDFQEAFRLTQESWQQDFMPVRKSWFSFGKVPRIVRQFQQETNKKLTQKSLGIALVLMCYQLVTAKLLDIDYYIVSNILVYLGMSFLIVGMVMVYIFSKIKKRRTRAELYFYNSLLNIFLCYLVLSMFGVFTKLPTNSLKIVYDFANGTLSYSLGFVLAAIISTIFTNAVTVYLFMMLRDRAKSLQLIKKFQNT